MATTVDHALALLDDVLGPPTEKDRTEELRRRMGAMGVFMPNLGIGTETRGCPSCGGTMISNYETDENGNIINRGPFICTNCGAVA
jgi:hypothetical protein